MRVNYPELAKATNKTVYAEGAVLKHPSGVTYRRVNGNWIIERNA
jgi:hypothetical protein